MKVYLVGGAVRDQLLGIPVVEKDWVVVGARPEQLLEQKYRQVGKDFPVFLHPKTQEEYALARTERKSAPGYYGFSCNFNPDVSLEDDLARRDLTINAIAMDEQGHLIDPYHGVDDLNNKILRHVSPAFIEDPVRVLRLARFAARFHHLGFTVAQETVALMYQMVQQGELEHLVAERVWQEWQRSLTEQNPEQFILCLRACGALAAVLPELDALFGVPNPQEHYPEIDTGIHSLMALRAAVNLTPEPATRFAALVHGLGKAKTAMQHWPKHYGHEDLGVAVIEALCTRLRIPNDYRVLATQVVRAHFNIHRLRNLCAEKVVGLLEQLDAFRRPQLFYCLLIACQAAVQGSGLTRAYAQADWWRTLLAECVTVNAQELIAQGYSGRAIKDGLHQKRVARVEQLLHSWNLNEK